ncbi:MAG: AAA family ATPase, partial [Myxococcota bacterium]|nr:AAA family ATPase [Myxococcota bacterium]
MKPLSPEQLTWRVADKSLDFEHTGEVEPSDVMVGQDIAMTALRQGVQMDHPGYNIFVAGLYSGGRLRTIERILRGFAPRRRNSRDLVYVQNHDDPSRPTLLELSSGTGAKLRWDLAEVARDLFRIIPDILDTHLVRARRDHLHHERDHSCWEALNELMARAEANGFSVDRDEAGADGALRAVLVAGEHRLNLAQALQASSEGRLNSAPEEVDELFETLEGEISDYEATCRRIRAACDFAVREVEQEEVEIEVERIFSQIRRRYRRASGWLQKLQAEVNAHLDTFRVRLVPDDATSLVSALVGVNPSFPLPGLLAAFQVNVFHRGSRSRFAPIVLCDSPSFSVLFGGIDQDGTYTRPPNHTDLRAGAIHDADGGFLVLNADELLDEQGAWTTLRRAMMFGQIPVQNLSAGSRGPAHVRPDPVPLDVKIVLLGSSGLFSTLYYHAPDFPSLVKIKAEFETVVDYSSDLPRSVAAHLARMGKRENLRPLDAGAVSRIVEWAVRQGGRGGRINLAFGELTDLAREANFLASGDRVGRTDVQAALSARRERRGRSERWYRDALERDVLHVETDGRVCGQINGLAVLRSGGHTFGRPLRITATIGTGRGGFVSIEREVGLAGTSHKKGVQILTGLIRGRFGRHRTLALTATLCVEQSYGRIDGDSASSTEVYALLSALSGVPID